MAWKKQHLLAVPSDMGRAADGLCEENWVCNILELATLEMDDFIEDDDHDDDLNLNLPSSRSAEKSKIGYVLTAVVISVDVFEFLNCAPLLINITQNW